MAGAASPQSVPEPREGQGRHCLWRLRPSLRSGPRLCSSLQSHQVGEQVVHVVLAEPVQQLVVGGQGILYINLHVFTGKRAIPARGFTQADGEFVKMNQFSLDLLAPRKRDGYGGGPGRGGQHVRFKLQRSVAASNVRQVSS